MTFCEPVYTVDFLYRDPPDLSGFGDELTFARAHRSRHAGKRTCLISRQTHRPVLVKFGLVRDHLSSSGALHMHLVDHARVH
jgi:hypothetical protein